MVRRVGRDELVGLTGLSLFHPHKSISDAGDRTPSPLTILFMLATSLPWVRN